MRPVLAPFGPVLALALGTACHHSHGGSPPLTVTAVQPIPFVAYRDTAFTVTGSGFLRTTEVSIVDAVVAPHPLPGQEAVSITFRAATGTPFANGTSAEVTVPGTVISDTEVTGTLPATTSSGGWLCTIAVTDALGTAESASPVSLFFGLTVFDIDEEVIRGDQATPFEVVGLLFLPIGGNATVRFTSSTPGAFPGGATTIDVPGTVVDADHVAGTTPVLALTSAVQAFVSVVLTDEPGAPQAISNNALVEFLPPPPVPVVVTSIAPSSLPLATPTSFTITGSGFLGAANANVEVTFLASLGTPLFRGTAIAVTVLGTAVNDTTVTGISPTGTAPSDVDALVRIDRADGVNGTSATAIAHFTVPTETVTTFEPSVVPADTVTAFTITGTNLPAAQTATVRFRAVEGTPFGGGTTDTADVVANVASTTQITGGTPLATTTSDFLVEVIVLLQGGRELPMGVRCLFTAPVPPPTSCVVTNDNDSGPGSLRAAIATAQPGCVISFDPGVTGDIDVASTLVVSTPVTILGPGVGQLAVNAAGVFPDFPIFTVQPTAAGTSIQRLTIRGSRHNNDGGGFRVRGDLTLTQCVVASNQIAGRGAALCVTDNSDVTLIECTLRDNSTTNRGGTFVGNGSTLTASRCTFNANSSNDGGGGIALDNNASLAATNCTFQGNEANGGSGGGGLLISSGATANLTHCTFAENTCNSRGGGVVVQGTLNAVNSIFSRNCAGQDYPEIWSTGTNHTTFSLVRVGDGSGLANGVAGNLVGTRFLPVDARLDDLQQNGGPTATMALGVTSPARNAASAAASVAIDQRGVLRPQGPAPDMGAYEANVNL